MNDAELMALAALVQMDAVRARGHLQSAIANDSGPLMDPGGASDAEQALDAELRERGILK